MNITTLTRAVVVVFAFNMAVLLAVMLCQRIGISPPPVSVTQFFTTWVITDVIILVVSFSVFSRKVRE